MKVLLILADGMRPDSLHNVEFAQKIIQKSTYTMDATTVIPSVSLPCYMSLFHSVDPDRHGIIGNTCTPQAIPIRGLCEVIKDNKKKSAFFYDWEAARDLSLTGSLEFSYFYNGMNNNMYEADDIISEAAAEFLKKNKDVDFTFLVLGSPDSAGHTYGYMSDEYIQAIEDRWKNISDVMNCLTEEYVVIIVADHGGHGCHHGIDWPGIPEDITIPIIIYGKDIEKGKVLKDANIKDIAPTITKLLGIEADNEWEGKSLL